MLYQESETMELKQEYAESIRKDIIAFANTNGGVIYIGVKDGGEVAGVSSPDQVIQRVSSMARDSIKPDVTMFLHYETENAEKGKIVKISVNRGTGRPYYWAEKGLRPSGVYVRQGTSAAPATEAAIRQMIKETDGDSYEERRSLNQELSFQYAADAFARDGMAFGPPQMKTLGVLSADGIYTNLGLLLSDQCPHSIKAAVFSGADQSAFQDRREFSGSLLKQAEDAYSFLELRNENAAVIHGLHRINYRAYPEAALREALLNAIAHRDYAFSSSTLISCYADRTEITSAGGLVQGFTLSDVMMGFSVCRNPKLANVLYRLDLIESYGTGLKKILSAYPSLPPEKLFQVTDNVFKVTLPRLCGAKARGPVTTGLVNEETLLSRLSFATEFSRADVERIMGVSTASAARLLRGMVAKGMLKVAGAGKNTRYIPVRQGLDR